MVMMPGTLTEENEATYDQLISLIENSQDRLALIIVGCDDRVVRDRVVERYEAEAKVAQIRSYRIVLGENLSLRSGLARLAETEADLREGKAAVFTVTGADLLMRVKSDPEMEQSELDAFFGYLQWTREGLREFRYPIVLWVSLRILQEMGRRAPDFWSWRKAVLRFGQEDQRLVAARQELPMRLDNTDDDDEFLPPLEELLAEVEELEKTLPDSQGLPTLYAKLGQVYAHRIGRGEAKDLVAEQDEAVKWFERAIEGMQAQDNESSLIAIFHQFGEFLDGQSQFKEATQVYEKSLDLANRSQDKSSASRALDSLGTLYRSLGDYRKAIELHTESLKINKTIGNQEGLSASLCNLGNAYSSLGNYHKAIDFYTQCNEISRIISNLKGVANSLGGLGSAYYSLGDYHRTIDFHTQSLKIKRMNNDQCGIAVSLGNLGISYEALEDYPRAIDFHTQSLKIKQTIGDRYGEAISLFNIAISQAKLDNHWLAKQNLEQAKAIYIELGLDHEVEECDGRIYAINQIIASNPIKAPKIGSSEVTKKRSRHKSIPVWSWFCLGIVLVLLIAWLLR
jgi:tetratricopeptide (TPR) repeat protein